MQRTEKNWSIVELLEHFQDITNESRNRLKELTCSKIMPNSSTFFFFRTRKRVWASPDGTKFNHIDYALLEK